MRRTLPFVCAVVFSVCAYGASVDKAIMLRKHLLLPQAKAELIEVIFGTATDAAKARAFYELGTIDFAEKNVGTALETWTQLVEKYPTSEQAGLVKDRIKELAEIVGEASKATAENAVAQSYISNADFWSEGKDQIFHIDPAGFRMSTPPPSGMTKQSLNTQGPSLLDSHTKASFARSSGGKSGPIWRIPWREGEFRHLHASGSCYVRSVREGSCGCRVASSVPVPNSSGILAASRLGEDLRMAQSDNCQVGRERETFYKDLAQRRLVKVEC